MLDRDAEIALLHKARAGDGRAEAAILRAYEPLCHATARKWTRRPSDREDLVQAARIGVINAIRRWDPSRGATLGIAALAKIETASACRDQARLAAPIVVPSSSRLHRLRAKMGQIEAGIASAVAAGSTEADAIAELCRVYECGPELLEGARYAARARSAGDLALETLPSSSGQAEDKIIAEEDDDRRDAVWSLMEDLDDEQYAALTHALRGNLRNAGKKAREALDVIRAGADRLNINHD